MRAFIALELSKGIKNELARCQEKLKKSGADVKWVKTCNIHLTLKFLGEIPEEKLSGIKKILDSLAEEQAPFEISLFKFGAFPNLDHPRVVWAGTDKGCSEAEGMADILSRELEKIGFPEEGRRFSAHLTVGRIRSDKNKESLKNLVDSLEVRPESCDINEIILFKSTLTPDGPIYDALYKAELKGSIR